MRATTLAVALLIGLPACSLMGYSDIDPPRCQVDSDCLPVSALKGVHPGCLKYECDEGACVRRRDGEEVHDGFDNDCDGLVDEPSVDESGVLSQTISPSGSETIDGVPDSAVIAYATSPSADAFAAWALRTHDADEGWFVRLDSASPTSKRMGYLRNQAAALQQTDVEPGCNRVHEGSIDGGPLFCEFLELSIDVTANAVLHEHKAVLVASVSGVGCEAGQLRVGFFELGEDPNVILRGPSRRSNSYLGVDLSDNGACSEVSTSGGTSTGVARPTLAVLEREGHSPQALVSWIANQNSRDECGGESAPVRVIGAFLESNQTFNRGFGWVTTTNEAESQNLGYTNGGGRPSVVALADEGYLVGYGDENGALALHFIPTPDDPPVYDGYTCCAEGDHLDECAGVDLVCSGEHDRAGLETQPIEGIVTLDPIDPGNGGSVDHVVISVGTVDDTIVELGVVWLEGCGTDTESVGFRRLVLRSHGGRPVEIDEIGPVERLAGRFGEGRRIGSPTLAYQDIGFVLEGFERGGITAAEQDLGGWFVAWSVGPQRTGQVFARRVLELDGRVLDLEERLELTGLEPGVEVEARMPFVNTLSSGVVFAFHDTITGALVVSDIQGTAEVGL